jgi:hypothetical protein
MGVGRSSNKKTNDRSILPQNWLGQAEAGKKPGL